MTKWIRTFWSDVSRGENIDLYVTLLAAFILAVVNLVVDFKSWTTSAILAVLGVLTIAALGTRHKIGSLVQRLGVEHTPPLRRRKDLARLPESAKEAKDLLIVACSASAVLLDTQFFIERIRQGTRVRLAVVNPDEEAVIDIIGRSDIVPAKTLIADMNIAAGLIERIRTQVPNTDLFDVRVFSYVPTLSFVMIDGYLPTGRIIVEMYPYQTDPGQRPHLLVTARDHPDWYGSFRDMCEAIWRDAKPSSLHSASR